MILRDAGSLRWLLFFGFVLAAWGGLFLMQAPGGSISGATLASLCGANNGQAGFGVVFLMWAVMSAAMMAPTLVPTLRTYGDLTHTSAASGGLFAVLVGAYLMIWLGYSALAAVAQQMLAGVGLLDAGGASVSWGVTAALLAVAGAYQFSSLKEACLSQCRAPMTFFMAHWSPGFGGAARMGVRLGLVCLGCCWALMALAFVGGVMNLVWMGLATVLMVVEKLPQLGGYVTRPLGVILLAGAVGATLAALGI